MTKRCYSLYRYLHVEYFHCCLYIRPTSQSYSIFSIFDSGFSQAVQTASFSFWPRLGGLSLYLLAVPPW